MTSVMADIVRAGGWHDYWVIRIGPRLKAFAWGQTDSIPRMLGLGAVEGPVAEAWFGAHESAPSPLHGGGDLATHIAAHPGETVGDEHLPYLLKILAIASPLSIQVHPTSEQARAGFDEEEDHRIALDDPKRVFRDPRHKPEMIVAITPVRALVGFRDAGELERDLHSLGADDLADLVRGSDSLLDYVIAVLDRGAGKDALDRLAHLPDGDSAKALAGRAARAFPGDPGALVALAMNPVILAPGQACYVPPRVIHSYQSGIGVEIMANSDNVVRGGLTPKAMDVALLEDILDAQPRPADRPYMEVSGPATTYTVPADEFALIRLEHGETSVPASARILLALDETTVTTASGSETLEAGEAAFIPLADGVVTIATEGVAFVALPGGAVSAQR